MPQVRLWSYGCAIVAIAGVLAAAAPAAAQEEVIVTVTGEIEPSCGLSAGSGTVDLGALDQKTSERFAVGVDCNHPFTYTLSSQNGGLRHEGGIAFVGNFTELLPYEIEIDLPLEDGDTARINQTCDSDAIRAGAVTCGFADSGTSIAIEQTALFEVRWSTTDRILLAGTFADELTLSVAVRP